jgi:L-ascorbate 6-phosphate lactonase
MASFVENVARRTVAAGQLATYWLCQSGFLFKTSVNELVYVDPYFSDVVERIAGFKRMMTCPLPVEDAKANLVVCTHEHADHMDTDALSVLAKNPKTQFAGPIECMKEFEKQGIPGGRCHLLEEGKSITVGSVQVSGVYADHGELAPDALGVVLNFSGIKVYHTGDTAYRPEQFRPAIEMRPDILLPCINGAFGNMDAREAALLTSLINPKIVVPTHFWMFVEQNGDPGAFLNYCKDFAPQTKALLMKPGEELLFKAQK